MLYFVTKSLNIFQEKINQKDRDDFEIKIYKWNEYAVKELEWTPELLYAIINTPQSINSDRKIVSITNSVPLLKNLGESNDCDCNADPGTEGSSSANWFPCVLLLHHCKTDSGCDETSWGCSNLWWYRCYRTCV